ncbi:MAG: hypothetical protein K6B38_14060 [Ruminococcus sp.]|nr:hypothetical protein [Ruminococcus sp.]
MHLDLKQICGELYGDSVFALPKLTKKRNPIAAMEWGNIPHSVEARLVSDRRERVYLMIDLKTGKPVDASKINGVLLTPACLCCEEDEETDNTEE